LVPGQDMGTRIIFEAPRLSARVVGNPQVVDVISSLHSFDQIVSVIVLVTPTDLSGQSGVDWLAPLRHNLRQTRK
jgi:hypothetical protein